MLRDYDGKPVNFIVVNEGNISRKFQNTAEQPNGLALVYEHDYLGDHSEEWVVQLTQEGIEKNRFNCKFITQINWL